MNEPFDLTIIGGGPAGLSALAAIAETTGRPLRVALIDNRPQPGGQYYLQPPATFEAPRQAALHHRAEAQALFARARAANAEWLLNTDVWSAAPLGDAAGWQLDLRGPDGVRRLNARAVILAVGAYDRPVPFPGWTLPGVLTAGAAQNLLKSQGVLPGRRIVVSGSGPLCWAVAANLIEAGAQQVTLLEAAPRLIRRGLRHLPALWGQWARLREGVHYGRALRRARAPIYPGWAAIAAHGEDEVRAVEIARLGPDWRPLPGAGNRRALEADTLVVGYGFTPATQLSRLMGCQHIFDPIAGCHVPARGPDMAASQPGVWIAGDGAGIGGAALAMVEGEMAGIAAARHLGGLNAEAAEALLSRLRGRLRRERRFAALLGALFTPAPGFYTLAQDDTLICRCEDVRLGEIVAAARAGARTVNEVKGLTRAGMGFCQGRMCGEAVARAIARAIDPADTTPAAPATPRPPLWPLTLDELSRPVETRE